MENRKNPEARKEYLRKYQSKWLFERKKQWLLQNGPCSCGSWEDIEVDHKDPTQKVTHRVWGWSKERRDEELKKCQALCRSCHKKKSKAENVARWKGKPRPHLRTVADEQFLAVISLIETKNLSEREACAKVGMKRGTFSSCKIRKARQLFNDQG